MLTKITYTHNTGNSNTYPLNLPWLKQLSSLTFQKPITFFVGDNGIGKSSLIQALAINAQLPQLTNEQYENCAEYHQIAELSNQLNLQWSVRSQRGFFFRADNFMHFVKETKKLKFDLENELHKLDERGVSPLAFERQPFQNSLDALRRSYPIDLDNLSHGQSFLALFQRRLAPNSSYILDEPETPLSPQNQLALVYLIDEQIKLGSQFIIVMHSPILTAHPDAQIYEINAESITTVSYEEIENVKFMKEFMSDPHRFMYYTLNDSN